MAGILGGYATQNSILGDTERPRIPWGSNPVVSMIGASLLGAPTLQQGFQNVGRNFPAGMALKAGMQDDIMKRRDDGRVKDAWNRVIVAKSAGQPIPPDAQAIIAQANPAIAAAMFKDATGLAGSDETFFGNPIYTQDETGNLSLNQLGNQGTLKNVPLAPGQKLAPPTTTQDTGTEIITFDRYGNELFRTPKDVRGAEREKKVGEGEADAIINLPQAEAAAGRMVRYIDDALNDPDLGRVTGVVGGAVPTWLDSNPEGSARAQSRIDQILGATFLQAFESLKGGGQITEVEGQKATDALNRLRTQTMSDEDYKRTLAEFRQDVLELVGIARRKAGGGIAPAPNAAPAGPSSGPVSWQEYFQ